jgi:hypothetical protein
MRRLVNIHTGQYKMENKDHLVQDLLIFKAFQNGYFSGDTVFYLPYKEITGYPLLDSGFHGATAQFALYLEQLHTQGSEEWMLASYYAGLNDSVFHLIQESPIKYPEMLATYQDYVKGLMWDGYSIELAAYAGGWVPTGKLGILGNHPSVGFQMGVRAKKGWGVFLNMNQRFNNLPDSISFSFNDTLRSTNRYIGGYYGLDLAKNIIATPKHEMCIVAGAALDGFNTTHDIAEEKRYVETFVNSLNINLGLKYRFIVRQSVFTEFQLRYNFINYTKNVTGDLSGNAITFSIGFGFMTGGKMRMDMLKHLEYEF